MPREAALLPVWGLAARAHATPTCRPLVVAALLLLASIGPCLAELSLQAYVVTHGSWLPLNTSKLLLHSNMMR
jgi:hypothetical protein